MPPDGMVAAAIVGRNTKEQLLNEEVQVRMHEQLRLSAMSFGQAGLWKAVSRQQGIGRSSAQV